MQPLHNWGLSFHTPSTDHTCHKTLSNSEHTMTSVSKPNIPLNLIPIIWWIIKTTGKLFLSKAKALGLRSITRPYYRQFRDCLMDDLFFPNYSSLRIGISQLCSSRSSPSLQGYVHQDRYCTAGAQRVTLSRGCDVIAKHSLCHLNTLMSDNFTKKFIILLLSHSPSLYSFGFPSREREISIHR